MVKWSLYLFVVLNLLAAAFAEAQDAYDEEAFEESPEVKAQRLEVAFQAALEVINAGGLGRGVKEIKGLAVEGHARSQYMLGMFFRYGTGVRMNSKRSVQWLSLGAAQELPAAMLAYAEVALSGDGMRRNEKLARELLEPLTAKVWNFPGPMEDFGVMRSIRSQASAMLGAMLAEGEGGPEDYDRAIRLTRSASDSGYLYASMFLALEYAKGERVDRDLDEARKYFDLVELQMMDSVRREFEKGMMGIVDPVIEAEIRENAAEMGQGLAKGLIMSQWLLAKSFLDEESEEYDPGFAASLLKMAAEGEDAVAQSMLGLLYWKGLGVEQDLGRAKALFDKASAGDSAVGRFNSAVMALANSEDSEEVAGAKKGLELAASRGHFAAQLVLDGEQGLSGLSDDEDLALAEEWKKRGDPRAVFALAKRAERGWNVTRESKPMRLFKRYLTSAKKGYHRAQYEVGEAYYYGRGPERNYAKALVWLDRAAEQSNLDSYFRLGYMYNNGMGTSTDHARSFRFYEKAFETGDGAVANNLANLYFAGKGVEKDEAKAFELYKLAAEKGDKVACYNMGTKYLAGDGLEPNEELGLEWLARSGESGYMRAILKLCDHYQEGAVSSDFVELAYWREKAAENGNRMSMKEVAIFYQKGLGVPVSNMKAMQWISAYVNNGWARNIKIRSKLRASEPLHAIKEFLPLDYEAILVYVGLLMEEDWAGHNLQAALETALLFDKTDLFAGRLLLAELYLEEELKGAKPKAGLRLYERIYEAAIVEKRFYQHAAQAAYALANEYGGGLHVAADDALCAAWMKKAADVGLKGAHFEYAAFLWDGVGCEQNRPLAVLYLVRLSNAGYANATLRLGELVLAGEAVDIDHSLLETRLRDLLAQGNARARMILKSMGVELPEETEEEVTPSADDSYRPAVLG